MVKRACTHTLEHTHTHTHAHECTHTQYLFNRSKPETTRIALKMHFTLGPLVHFSHSHIERRSIIQTVLPFLYNSIMFVSGIVDCIVVACILCVFFFLSSHCYGWCYFLYWAILLFCFVKICTDSFRMRSTRHFNTQSSCILLLLLLLLFFLSVALGNVSGDVIIFHASCK